MINFLQSNHTQIDGNSLKIISSEFWENLLRKFKDDRENVQIFIQDSCVLFNINIVTFLKKFLLFIIRNKTDKINSHYNAYLCFILVKYELISDMGISLYRVSLFYSGAVL